MSECAIAKGGLFVRLSVTLVGHAYAIKDIKNTFKIIRHNDVSIFLSPNFAVLSLVIHPKRVC